MINKDLRNKLYIYSATELDIVTFVDIVSDTLQLNWIMSITSDSLTDAFGLFAIEFSEDDETLLSKMKEACVEMKWDAPELADAWVSHCKTEAARYASIIYLLMPKNVRLLGRNLT